MFGDAMKGMRKTFRKLQEKMEQTKITFLRAADALVREDLTSSQNF
jgi:hypothetical protein